MTVWITIRTVRTADGEKERLELVTTGDMELTADGCVLTYSESESIGLIGVTTVMTVTPSCVTMERRGAMNTLMVMEKGKRTHCEYDTGFGFLMMGIYTGRIRCRMDETGGEIDFSYTLDINAGMTSAHDIAVRVQTEKDKTKDGIAV